MAYMLITVNERNITTKKFDSYKQAHRQMVEELKNEYFLDDRTEYDWEEVKETFNAEGSYEGNDFGLYEYEAWSNIDSNYDWKIVEI